MKTDWLAIAFVVAVIAVLCPLFWAGDDRIHIEFSASVSVSSKPEAEPANVPANPAAELAPMPRDTTRRIYVNLWNINLGIHEPMIAVAGPGALQSPVYVRFVAPEPCACPGMMPIRGMVPASRPFPFPRR